jgi:beta-lactamase class D
MKRFAPPLVSLFAGLTVQAADWVSRPDWQQHFDEKGVRGTFVLYEPATNRYSVLDEKRAHERFLPASTFKIPNALIGLEVGSIKDEKEVFRWDGKAKVRREWERDQTLNSGMRDSVVWMFQEVARRTGKARMREWLERFDYGNKDVGGGVDYFWLQGALRISAVEQVDFLRKLEEGRLPVSQRSRQLVRNAMVFEKASMYTIRAKTGTSGYTRDAVGWWVGWVEKGGKPVAYFAMNYTPNTKTAREDRFAISRAILAEAKLL